MGEDEMSLEGAARALGVHRNTIGNWLKEGKLESRTMAGPSGYRRVSRASVRLQLARQRADLLSKEVFRYVDAKTRNDVQCPRERSFMTPCIARDGGLAVADDGTCVACSISPAAELSRMLAKGAEDAH